MIRMTFCLSIFNNKDSDANKDLNVKDKDFTGVLIRSP